MAGDPHHIAVGDPTAAGDHIAGARDSGPPGSSLSARWEDLDLHRVELAARLLVLKQPRLGVEALLARTASEVRSHEGELDAALFIAEMIRVSAMMPGIDEAARSMLAAERLAELQAALTDQSDVIAMRSLRRRGEFTRPLPLPAQRRVRRACWQLRPEDAGAATLEPLSTPVWDELLDTLARSLAFERAPELAVDIAIDGRDELGLANLREHVRQALARGEQLPATARPLASDELFSDPGTTGGGPAQWPPPEREVLPAGHRVGRFTLLHRLGVGAMGVVYAAYDPELDRRIAVKLLRARQGPNAARAQARLLREAQAMARLNHPHVAVVHDVGTHEGDVFVAMEFVRGETLQSWLRKQPRSWREVVEVFVQAGRGLAAAHAAGLVHRDFKPSNAMMGDDGRVRVLDFGLCYTESITDSSDPTASGSSMQSRASVRITRHEEVVGTPAYMPPEQFLRGGVVGPASDQFSLCASLYEALYGQLPFAGETVQEVTRAIALGELRPPPRASRVPGWLHAVVQRGLRPDPAQRFPSMDALLRALDRSRARARGGVLVAAALAVGTGLGGFWAARTQAVEVDPCTGGASQIVEVWGPTRRASTAQALAAAGPAFAEELWPQVAGDLDRYTTSWQESHRDACEAHRRGETSGTLLDRRMACLEQRKAALREAVTVLAEADAEVALHALEVVSHLPTLERCSDLVALEADVSPPSDPEVRAAVAALRPRIARVQALEHAGLFSGALTLADEVVRAAEAIDDRAVQAEALLQRARLGINRLDRPSDQDVPLTRAYLTALGGRLDELATEALALRMYARVREEGKGALALDDLAVAREMIARMPSPGPVRGLVLNNAGVVYMAKGDLPQAAALFREALTAREAALGADHLEVAFTLGNLAIASPEAERMGLLRRALEIFDRQLGKAHPQTVEVRLAASLYALDPREARDLIAPGCEALGRFSPDDRAQRARCLGYLGHHAAEAGELPAAAEAFLEVEQLLATGVKTPLSSDESARLLGHAALHTGKHRPAIDLLRKTLAEQGDSNDPWQRRIRAELDLLLGQNLMRIGDREAAANALTSAVSTYEAAAANAPDVMMQQRLAGARISLAEHLLGGHPTPEQKQHAANLLAAANQWYRGAGAGYSWRLDELDALIRKAAI